MSASERALTKARGWLDLTFGTITGMAPPVASLAALLDAHADDLRARLAASEAACAALREALHRCGEHERDCRSQNNSDFDCDCPMRILDGDAGARTLAVVEAARNALPFVECHCEGRRDHGAACALAALLAAVRALDEGGKT